MKFRATIFLPLCLTLLAWSQLTFTVPVVDKSDSGSPLEISGTASFTEEVVGNSVTASSEYTVMARNMSGKGVVLLVAYFDEAGPHGGSTHHVLEFDHFFRRDIGPGESFVLDRNRPGRRSSWCCINPLEGSDEPKAEVHVQFAQFGDGSTFGDEAVAKDILATRSMIVENLRRLEKATEDKEFLQLLSQRMKPDAADGFFEAVRYTQKNEGTATTRAEVRASLAFAEQHAAAKRSEQAAQ